MYPAQSSSSNGQVPSNHLYEERAIAPVKEIVVRGAVNVWFKPGPGSFMILRGDSAAGIKSVKTLIQNNILHIDRDQQQSSSSFTSHYQEFSTHQAGHHVQFNSYSSSSQGSISSNSNNVAGSSDATDVPSGRVDVGISLPVAPHIRSSGTSNILIEGVNQPLLEVCSQHTASIKVIGRVNYLDASVSGVATVDASGLVAQNAKLTASGAGKIKAQVLQRAQSSTDGVAKIWISGNPSQRDSDIGGLGKITYVNQDVS